MNTSKTEVFRISGAINKATLAILNTYYTFLINILYIGYIYFLYTQKLFAKKGG